ncbi:trypsin-like peptidase domain-containing protein [Lewinella sp. JB7]|uniref:trypsin-like peptidase domain-containing protein n=1 Tax=Lewinella sp. JB7 TaxID=2962887 RepID=UPI0020C9C18C|nr:trypsin-like peptidase domain-containing protein [Lewinella sp. JB7]MCP9236921.1 trypsin-like peptidase domain-containing protein [Lewinella sp. JB7]
MKKLLLIVFVAVLGGLIALGGANYLGWGKTKYVEVPGSPATYTNFTNAPRVVPAPTDGFVVASERALPAVVHIKASKRADYASRGGGSPFGNQLPDALRDLFGNPGRGDGDGEMPLQQGSGSGVIISSDGYIVSNNHVVADAETLEVVLNDERTYTAKVIGTDPTTDIALIKIEETGLTPIAFGNSDEVKVGQWVVAVGNPFSLTSTVTAGIVSAKGRSIDIVRRSGGDLAIESFIQTDAVVNPGNSGGALVNQNGDLIGINTAISSPTGVFAGYSFAVPSAIVKKVAEDLREFGVVQRGLLGARIQQVNTLTDRDDIDRNDGVYVAQVMDGSAAQEAGVKEGDIILSVDGVPTLRSSDLLEQLGRHRPGDKVVLTVERDGKERDLTAELKNSNGTTGVVRVEDQPTEYTALGAEFEELNDDTAAQLGLDGGVVVNSLGNGLLTQQTRVRPGFILTKVDGRKVTGVDQLKKLLDTNKDVITIEGVYPDNPSETYKYAIVK